MKGLRPTVHVNREQIKKERNVEIFFKIVCTHINNNRKIYAQTGKKV